MENDTFKLGLENYSDYLKLLNCLQSGRNTLAFGMQEGERILVGGELGKFTLYVSADYLAAQKVLHEMEGLGRKFFYIPYTDDVLLYKRAMLSDGRTGKLNALKNLCEWRNYDGAVMSAEALIQLYPDCASFRSNTFEIKENQTVKPSEIVKKLINCGYKRKPLVEVEGDFSLRGDILDIFNGQPYRLEFFGDTVESIKLFDVSNQKSLKKMTGISLYPNCLVFADKSESVLAKLKEEIDGTTVDNDAKSRLNEIHGELSLDSDNEFLLPFADNSYLSDYFPEDCYVVFDGVKLVHDRLGRMFDEHYARCAYLIERGEMTASGVKQLHEYSDVFNKLRGYTQLGMMNMITGSFFTANEIVKFNSYPPSNYRYSLQSLIDDIEKWRQADYEFAVFAGDEEGAESLCSSLAKDGIYLESGINRPCIGGCVIPLDFSSGYVSVQNRLAIVGTQQLKSRSASKRSLRKAGRQVFFTPQVNDFVVHDYHGVGLCKGITTLDIDGQRKDYIEVQYRKGDTLYVPVEASNLLCKYSGSDQEPKLSTLGGGEFERVKSKVKSGLKELAFDLVKLYAARQNARSRVYLHDEVLEEMFADAFPYRLTVDQQKSVEEINADLDSGKIMDRLLCGDVGFGKTEVAMRAMFRVAASGYQVAFLAPTTILSEQHFETVRRRFMDFNIKVVCVNRFRSAKLQKEILKAVKNGEADIVIGTHRMLSGDVEFKNLGLLVLDEEQRFGVEHKEKLKNAKNTVDVLTMTATPIPRTLHMSLVGIRDISTITTPPIDRLPVESYVIEDSLPLYRDIIIREMKRNGQVFFVYNRVDTIDAFAASIGALVPEARIVVGHGQMDNSFLERNIYDFANGIYDILICTTIIENGIDLPNANTLIVYDADKLGLSQLYQLRGRVGRSNRLAYAYFVYKEGKVLSPDAYKRLNSIMENTQLGSGFRLAMRDLEIRGAGNILGKEQHGHIASVGFEMYTKLLKEAINESKGELTPETVQTETEIALTALIPTGYIDDAPSRMEAYRRISDVKSAEEEKELEDELRDVYGVIPKETRNLIAIAYIRGLANALCISKVVINRFEVKAVLADVNTLKNVKVQKAIGAFREAVKLNSNGDSVELVFSFEGSIGFAVGGVKAFLEMANGREISKAS
ncbi:MAG: transcription-repair coupling factor [Clostridia bacterium]|nr:transcription-repair coupling factor [Clostridia bacterium]